MGEKSDTGLSQQELAAIKADIHLMKNDLSIIRAALSKLVFGSSAGPAEGGPEAPLDRLMRNLEAVAAKLP